LDYINLQFYKPADNGGSEITKYELYINNGDPLVDPIIKVASYIDNAMTH